jgi:hypothetical protein
VFYWLLDDACSASSNTNRDMGYRANRKPSIFWQD